MKGNMYVIQLGEGKLLRTLIDPIIYEIIEDGWGGKIVVTNLTKNGEHNIDELKHHNGNYCIFLRNDKEISKKEINITPLSLKKDWQKLNNYMETEHVPAIVSNSTEAGFVLDRSELNPSISPNTYIGILCSLLFSKYKRNYKSSINVFPTELLENNGILLHNMVLKQSKVWSLNNEFGIWLESHVKFINTWVDRIVTNVPLGNDYYKIECNGMITSIGEKYGKWWIESSEYVLDDFPIYRTNEVELVNNIENYYRMKVWVLNAAHLFIACLGLIYGFKTVSEAYKENKIRKYVLSYWNEIRELIAIPINEVDNFIDNTDKRFKQEWLNHQLKSIAVNVDIKWHTRIEPAMEEYKVKKGYYNDSGLIMTIFIGIYKSRTENIEIENAIELLIGKESSLKDAVINEFRKSFNC